MAHGLSEAVYCSSDLGQGTDTLGMESGISHNRFAVMRSRPLKVGVGF